MKPRYLLTVMVAMLIAGCAATETATKPATRPKIDEPQVNLAGYPPPFREGYLDGCNSARQNNQSIKDAERYKNDSMYASGWRDGYDICSSKQ
jgi:hypothetical protein